MKTTVAVIYGGRSGEHEISIRSAKAIMAALDRDRYDVVEYFIDPDGQMVAASRSCRSRGRSRK